MDPDPEDLRIDVFTNIAVTHVRITHLPTGIVTTGHDPERPRSERVGREIAMRAMTAELEQHYGSGIAS